MLNQGMDKEINRERIFSIRGFSSKRMAWLLVVISALLVPLHSRSDYQGDEYICYVAAGAMLAALVLGFCVRKTDRERLLPFAFGLLLLVVHSLLCKL